jgi:putative nucleotidyltransferase with HDIG domain
VTVSPRSPFKSKVARRIFGLFVVCALGPMVVLALISYVQVSNQLRAASRARQHQASKNAAIEVLTRFRALEGDLALAAVTVAGSGGHEATSPVEIMLRLDARFASLAVEYADGSGATLRGPRGPTAPLSAEEVAHLKAARTILRIDETGRLLMIRSFGDSSARLVAEVEPAFLWDELELVPAGMQVAVVAPSGHAIYSSWHNGFSPPHAVAEALKTAGRGDVEWTAGESRHLGSYWTVPMAYDFVLPGLTVLVSEERSAVFAPMVSARSTFLLVSLLSLWIVMWLSLVQVRRSMVPLTLLTEGAQRVGDGNLETLVHVKSGDEFEDVAVAFNAMTVRLQRQFQSLAARASLDRAVLSSLDPDTIMIAALDRLLDSVTGDVACLVTFARGHGDAVRAFIAVRGDGGPRKVTAPETARRNEEALLLGHATSFVAMEREQGVPTFLEPLAHTSWRRGVALPIVIEGRLAGVLTVGHTRNAAFALEDITQLRQITDQIAVALANAGLVQALDRLNVGTLNALARTVDAKSSWTAGHSQRVATMAVDLGRELGLGDETLDLITRGSLLHDIGKIAVPSAILDKAGRLTAAEYEVMKEHPRTGARILEPIVEYHRLIPIVLQHHEWFDGRGYPDGLAGDAISFEARIVAVADVFDALRSERPYRDAMDLDKCMRVIQSGRDTQFDPHVVHAFARMMECRRLQHADDAA